MNDVPMGWAGRVMEWLAFATRLVLINLLFAAGTLAGLVLLGLFPAAVAATTMLARLRAGAASDHLVRDFVTVYRSQFWHTNRVGGIFWSAGVVLFLNVLTMQGGNSPLHAVLLILAGVAGAVTLLAAFAAVAVCSRYRDSVSRTWRTAFLLPLVSPGTTLALLVSLVLLAGVFSGLAVLVPLIGASAPLLASGWLVERRLQRLAEPVRAPAVSAV